VADVMEKVPSREVGAGNFVIGSTKVRPRVAASDDKPAIFKRAAGQKINFWMQVYNLGVNEQTNKSSATIEYEILDIKSQKAVSKLLESTEQMGNVGEQLTLEKSMDLAGLPVGTYQLTIRVSDNISKQTIAPQAKFAVE
jgi:hypothetical protein